MARFRESITLESRPKIANGKIFGVKVLGNSSQNGRDYPLDVRQRAAELYEGARVNIDHPSGRNLERGFRDWVGRLENVQVKPDGTFADLQLRKKHPEFEQIVEAAQEFPRQFGLSHVADCESRRVAGRDRVTNIKQVFSVDIVQEPATTLGITESKGGKMKTATIEQIIESNAKAKGDAKIFREVLMEEMALDGGAVAGDTAVEVADPAGDDAIKSAIMAAVASKLEGASADQLKKVLKALEIGDSVSALVSGEAAPEAAAAAAGAAAATTESKRLDRLEAENLLHRLGREATEIQVEAVAALPAAKRKALIESFPAKATGGTVKESRSGRPASSPPANKPGGGSSDEKGDLTAIESAWQARRERVKKTLTEEKKIRPARMR